MQEVISPLVPGIRAASRKVVRQLGLMNKTVAGTDMSVSAVHAIVEIGGRDGLTAKALGELLLLEKSTISRLVRYLVGRGLVVEVRSELDGRAKHLHLTDRGRQSLAEIDHHATNHVQNALAQASPGAQALIHSGLQHYAEALKNVGRAQSIATDLEVKSGYTATVIGTTVALLQSHMARHFGFGLAFERRISSDMCEFMGRISEPTSETWRAEINGRIVGAISIDNHHLADGFAHLRWFVVDETVRGMGVGQALLSHAVKFCDEHGFPEIHLWTVKGLDSAARLYERSGFFLAEEYQGAQWGSQVTEHKFVRRCP